MLEQRELLLKDEHTFLCVQRAVSQCGSGRPPRAASDGPLCLICARVGGIHGGVSTGSSTVPHFILMLCCRCCCRCLCQLMLLHKAHYGKTLPPQKCAQIVLAAKAAKEMERQLSCHGVSGILLIFHAPQPSSGSPRCATEDGRKDACRELALELAWHLEGMKCWETPCELRCAAALRGRSVVHASRHEILVCH